MCIPGPELFDADELSLRRQRICLSMMCRNTFNASVLGRHSGPFAAGRRDRAPMDGFTACPVGRLAPAYCDASAEAAQKQNSKGHHLDPARKRISTVAAQGYAPASIRGRAPSMARSPVDMHSRSSLARCRCALTSDAACSLFSDPTKNSRYVGARPPLGTVRCMDAATEPPWMGLRRVSWGV